MRLNIVYEEKLHIDANNAFDLTLQWLRGQYKAKIKISTPPTFIEAKQGTMMTNTGHDPNWKKRIIINFYTLEGNQTLVRVEATPLARNIFRVEKLKQSWYEGLFSHLFSLLQTYGQSSKQEKVKESNVIQGSKVKYCTYCGNKLEENVKICPSCGIQIE
ncbi:MAG: zinc ribbon domain-containing protein [Candidatus Lokiarchaeia archaeon]|nr:zinc ribbon domain-containing protein [Candidatus Lokiarchaeia archaeon]